MTNLQDKAVKVKGKDYVLVKDRVLAFLEEYPKGRIETRIERCDGNMFVVKAVVVPDVREPEIWFTGHSQAVVGQGEVNKTSALENAETSAVGRALAFMGIGVLDSVASADEIAKSRTGNSAPAYFNEAMEQRNTSKTSVSTGKPIANPAADYEALNDLGL
jgi:hypothetical protein